MKMTLSVVYDFKGADTEGKKEKYIAAVVAGYREDFVPLTTLFTERCYEALNLGEPFWQKRV